MLFGQTNVHVFSLNNYQLGQRVKYLDQSFNYMGGMNAYLFSHFKFKLYAFTPKIGSCYEWIQVKKGLKYTMN